MPISMMRNGITAENSIFSQKPKIKVPSSEFDLGRPNFFTGDFGMLIPVDLIPTLPGDVFNLSCQYKIDFRPLLVPTLTAYKCRVHYYFCPSEYLWHGWETFISKGRSGNVSLTVPKVRLSSLDSSVKFSDITDTFGLTIADNEYYPYTPHSLAGYLVGSVPYCTKVVNDDGSEIAGAIPDHFLPFGIGSNTVTSTGFKSVDTNALPFLMYQKIYRSNYMDPNLYSNGMVKQDVWFPEDIDSSDWRFDYQATNIGGAYNQYFVPISHTMPQSGYQANFVPIAQDVNESTGGDNVVNLLQLRYAMYTDDMFTTALPFLQRGNSTTLDLTASSDSLLQQFYLIPSTTTDSVFGFSNLSDGIAVTDYDIGDLSPIDSDLYFTLAGAKDGSKPYGILGGQLTGSGDTSPTSISLGVNFTAQQLRSLLALSVWQERNALTNGSYGQFIKVHFDTYPDNQYCEPKYIGGTTSVFNVSAVVQTSASSTGSTPQGTQTGIGGTSNRQGIGTFRAPDFGFIMAIMSIIPDTSYVQTQDHWQFDSLPDDFYMPEFEQLSLQPVYNKQLFVSDVDSTDDAPFGYANRYLYLKQREGIARGMFALPSNVDAYYHSYVQSRIFTSLPKLSQQFVTVYPPNIDRSMLAYSGEPAFLCQFYSGVKARRKLSYVSQPNTFGF